MSTATQELLETADSYLSQLRNGEARDFHQGLGLLIQSLRHRRRAIIAKRNAENFRAMTVEESAECKRLNDLMNKAEAAGRIYETQIKEAIDGAVGLMQCKGDGDFYKIAKALDDGDFTLLANV